jgi:hypothetical protein
MRKNKAKLNKNGEPEIHEAERNEACREAALVAITAAAEVKRTYYITSKIVRKEAKVYSALKSKVRAMNVNAARDRITEAESRVEAGLDPNDVASIDSLHERMTEQKRMAAERRSEALRRQRVELEEQKRLKQLKMGVVNAWHDRPFKTQRPLNGIPGSKQIKVGPRACAIQETAARKLQQEQQRWAFSVPGKLQRPWSGSSCHGHITKSTNNNSTRPATATRPSSLGDFTSRGTNAQQYQTSNRVNPSRVGIQVGSAEYFDLDGLWRTATGEQTGGKFTDSRYERERAAFSSQQAYTAWFPTDEVMPS